MLFFRTLDKLLKGEGRLTITLRTPHLPYHVGLCNLSEDLIMFFTSDSNPKSLGFEFCLGIVKSISMDFSTATKELLCPCPSDISSTLAAPRPFSAVDMSGSSSGELSMFRTDDGHSFKRARIDSFRVVELVSMSLSGFFNIFFSGHHWFGHRGSFC